MSWRSSNSWYSTTGAFRIPEVDRDFNNDYVIQAKTDFWFKRVIANQTDFTGFFVIVSRACDGPIKL
jgi:hypothetical protein